MTRLAVEPVAKEAWTQRRRRAQALMERYPFALQLLRLYDALLEVQERAFLRGLDDQPNPVTLPRYVADHVMMDIEKVTVGVGPPALAAAVAERSHDDAAGFVTRWLAEERQPPVHDYLARAATSPVLEALGPAAEVGLPPVGDGACPRCGGRPQVSYLPDVVEALVSGPRMLMCYRCGAHWVHQRMTCVGCGEQATTKLPIFTEGDQFSHLRADACESCRRYMITVDLRKDPEAVPIVDELVALPLDLYVQEHGFAKLVPNLMAIG